tara:strand:+ start:493 stop:723 length:231 start_codon:yes stop_codon:yes gene_type:complete
MISNDERKEAEEDAPRLLTELLSAGLSYELIAVKMGDFMGGVNPSVTSLKRWKAGRNTPSKINSTALARVYREEKK